MPPLPHWYAGLTAVPDFALRMPLTSCGSWRHRPAARTATRRGQLPARRRYRPVPGLVDHRPDGARRPDRRDHLIPRPRPLRQLRTAARTTPESGQDASSPPSTTMVWPVTYPACGETRNVKRRCSPPGTCTRAVRATLARGRERVMTARRSARAAVLDLQAAQPGSSGNSPARRADRRRPTKFCVQADLSGLR